MHRTKTLPITIPAIAPPLSLSGEHESDGTIPPLSQQARSSYFFPSTAIKSNDEIAVSVRIPPLQLRHKKSSLFSSYRTLPQSNHLLSVLCHKLFGKSLWNEHVSGIIPV
mmetsp:Transcript_34667/g.60955  ORF Transcript_34667/g.60955 Transcript_34667/m.60955 type:complete len:110 (-) Transcript_34667:1059-1388(-)